MMKIKLNDLEETTEVPYDSYLIVDDGSNTTRVRKENLLKEVNADIDYLKTYGGGSSGSSNSGTNVSSVITYDDGRSIQALIDEASTTTHYVKLRPKTYNVGCITPKSNVVLDLNGATLFLNNNTEKPMFNKDGNLTNFAVINGKLDLNQANNHAVNQSAGGMWILNADHLYFANLEIVHAFRNIFNFYTCTDITIKDIYCNDCGMTNNGGFFTYGASFEKQCKNIHIDNFNMYTIHGFGIHIRKSTQAVLKNIHFQDFTRKKSSGSGDSIGITFTEADNVVLDNYTHINGDCLSIECNQSTNIVMNNLLIDNVKVPFVFGTNASDNSEERNVHIKINNLITTNSFGTCSLRLNYIYGLIIDNFDVDKGIETLTDIDSTDIIFKNGKFGTSMKEIYNIKRFHYENVEFSNITLKNYRYRYNNEICIPKFNLAAGANKTISIASMLAVQDGIFCKLLVYSHSTSSPTKASATDYTMMVYPGAVYLKEVSSLSGSEAKKVVVSASGGSLVFTNNTGSTLDVYLKTY